MSASSSFHVEGKTYEIVGVSDTDVYVANISGRAESKLQDFCRIFLDQDSVALDIGANIGVTPIILSHFLPNGRIIAIEPGATTFDRLQSNLKRNNIRNVEVRRCAISDQSGKIQFHENSAFGHIISAEALPEWQRTHDSVDCFTLDDLVDTLNLDRLDFIKIDIEGYEPQLFAGATKTIARFNPIIYFEFNSWTLLSHGKNNPFDFMSEIVRRFKFVYRVSKNLSRASVFDELPTVPDHLRHEQIVHDNMVCQGGWDDIVVSNNADKLNRGYIALATEIDALRSQNAHLRREVDTAVTAQQALEQETRLLRSEISSVEAQHDHVKRSKSFRYTSLLRNIRSKFP